jgi:hypothetical protein
MKEIAKLHSNRSGQSESDRGSFHSNPNSQRVGANLFCGETLCARNFAWNSDWDGGTADVAIRSQCNTSNRPLRGVSGQSELWCAGISSHAVCECGRELVVRHADDWPIDQAHHFLNDRLDPNLEHGHLCGYSVDDCLACGHVVEIRLMEHEGIVVQAEEVASVRRFLHCEEVIPITGGSRSVGVDPFEDGASRKLALPKSVMHQCFFAKSFAYIVVDICGPARVNLHTSVAIFGNGAHKRPHFIDLQA